MTTLLLIAAGVLLAFAASAFLVWMVLTAAKADK